MHTALGLHVHVHVWIQRFNYLFLFTANDRLGKQIYKSSENNERFDEAYIWIIINTFLDDSQFNIYNCFNNINLLIYLHTWFSETLRNAWETVNDKCLPSSNSKMNSKWKSVRMQAFLLYIRPWNTNWQDWKYTPFNLLIHYNTNVQCHDAESGYHRGRHLKHCIEF